MADRVTDWQPALVRDEGTADRPFTANDPERLLGPAKRASEQKPRDRLLRAKGKYGVERRGSRKHQRVDRDFDMLRLRVLGGQTRSPMRNDAFVVALMSRTRGEGVSSVAAGLARSFARNGDGRVLLVDADDVSNGLSKKVPTSDVTVFRDSENLDPRAPMTEVRGWDVDFLALGKNGNGRFVYGVQWEDCFSELRTRYDIIVVDAASLETGTPYNWADVPSHVILVVDTTRTSVKALERLREELKASGPAVTGIVLNKRSFPIPQFLY